MAPPAGNKAQRVPSPQLISNFSSGRTLSHMYTQLTATPPPPPPPQTTPHVFFVSLSPDKTAAGVSFLESEAIERAIACEGAYVQNTLTFLQ